MDGEALDRQAAGCGIPVDAQHRGAGGEQRRAVAAETERAVEKTHAGTRAQRHERCVGKHGDVQVAGMAFIIHHQALAAMLGAERAGVASTRRRKER